MTLTSVLLLMAVGILLGLAASAPPPLFFSFPPPPLAQRRRGWNPLYYVERQVVFGGLGIMAMLLISYGLA